jgi:peptide/nickel transport system permease protein
MRAISRFAAGNKAATMSLAFLIIVVVTAVFAPYLAPYDPDAQDFTAARHAPSLAHPLGTDFQGSDVLSKIIYGARPTVAVAFGVSTATVALGFLLGMLAGYRGGMSETIIMRVVDITLAFPALLLNIILVAILGAGFESLFLALTLTGWAAVARITRGLVISLANSQYVTSAHALGATGTRILLRHIVPNCASTIVIVFAMRAGATVLAAAGLNYLGLGDPQDTNSWGTMVNLAQFDIVTAWWWPLAPATAIALTVLAMNLIADAARDYLDPRSGANLAEQR